MGGNNANLLEEIRTTKKNLSLSSEAILTAHTNFTNQYNTFLSLAEQLENKFKELEGREDAALKKENETSGKAQQLEEREKKCVEKEKELEAREQKVKVNEERWTETENRMQQNAAKLPNVIQISVCGTKFAIAKENLLKHKRSLFEQMILTDHSQQIPSIGELFFERNPKLFKYIMHFLIFGEHLLPSQIQRVTLLEKEFQYFKIPFRIPTPL